jgi:LacI family transcriptional regulator
MAQKQYKFPRMTRRTAPLAAKPPRRRVLLALAWYSIAIHRGITRFAHNAGWILDGGFVREGSLAGNWRGDGIIAVHGIHADVDAALQRFTVPIVNIGYAKLPGIPSVAADSVAVGRLAAEHFLTRGFKNFAYYESSQTIGERTRFAGFAEVLKKAGRPPFRIGPPAAIEDGTYQPGEDRYALLARQLSMLPKPVAVTAEFDDRAIDVVDAALLAGLRVPEHVAVLGVDNDELRCPFAAVPLSSIDNDEERIGFESARVLQKLMSGQPAPTEPILVPPLRVVVRQSTNTLAIPHEHVAMALRMIWEHYTEPIDVTRVAAEIPLSYAQLHASFVKHVGHTMAEEIEARRLEHAKHLLANSDSKLTEIARLSGFGSADRMGRVFTRRIGITPSDYRAQATATQIPQSHQAEEAQSAPGTGGIADPSPAALMATSQQNQTDPTPTKSRKSPRK